PTGPSWTNYGGELDTSGNLKVATPSGGVALVGLTSGKPPTVHVSRRADGTRPGCLGTSGLTTATNWVPPTINASGTRTADGDDIDRHNRPTWRSVQMKDSSGNGLNFSSGRARYCEDHINPLALGNVAFF